MTPNDTNSNPSDLHIEVNAAVIEALLSARSKTLQPLAEMLGGFYTQLRKQNVPDDLAGACVLKLLEGTLASWIMSDRSREHGQGKDE